MDLTYGEIIDSDLSSLLDASRMWKEMSRRFGELGSSYRKNVRSLTEEDGAWTGVGSDSFRERSEGTLHEFSAAKKQANAVASLLKDAYDQLTDLKKKVEEERDAAVKAGMKVSEYGICSFDFSGYTPQERQTIIHDPGLAESENSWTRRIQNAVQAVSDADYGVRTALETVTQDRDGQGDLSGFNSKAVGDIEKYEGIRAVELSEKLNSGEKLSEKELEEFERLNRDNSDERVYSTTMLAALGGDGAVKLTHRIQELAYAHDGSVNHQYAALEKGFAKTVATATEVPGDVSRYPPGSAQYKQWLNSEGGKFYREWTSELREAGTKNYGSNTDPLYGYQPFVSMMKNSGETFDDQFLYDLGNDLITVEKEKPSLFTMWNGGHPGVETDPIDGVLAVMSRDPDTATAFLNPDGNGSGPNHVRNEHLKYLVGSGDGSREWPEHVMTGHTIITMDDHTSRAGLGAALEAATTGHPPLESEVDPRPQKIHTHAQARIMHETIKLLDGGPQTEIHANLRQPLANALGTYTPDTHQILSGNPSEKEYITEAGGDGVFGDGKLAVKADALTHVLRGISEDPEAYGTLHKAETRYVADQLDKLPGNAQDLERSGPLGQSGATLGAYSAIREDVIDDLRQADHSAADWKTKIAYHIIGGAVTPLPGGDAAQRMVDTWAYAMANEMKAEVDSKANAEISDHYLDANNQINLMVHDWADREGVPEKASGVTGEMLDGYDRGVQQADKYLAD